MEAMTPLWNLKVCHQACHLNVFPPPSLCELINVQHVQPQLSAPESGDEDEPDENENSVQEKNEFVVLEENGDIFDLLDQYYLWRS